MYFLSVSLRKDWARVRRDPMALLTAIGIPLVLAVLMSLIFGHDSPTPHGTLLVADEDNSMASQRMLEGFRREPLSKFVSMQTVTRDAGRQRIDRGEASAFLILPKGLQQSFLFNQSARLQLFTNPSESIIPKMIEETLSLTTDAAFYLRHGSILPDAAASGLIRVNATTVADTKRSVSFAAVFLPSMIFMGMLFTASSMALDIWKERMLGTLRRVAASPVSLASYLLARIAFVALVYVAVALIGLLAARWLTGMPVPNFAAAVLWMTFVGTVFYLFFLFLTLQPSNMRSASVLSNLIIFPLAMLGGCFFPFEWMPGWMVTIGKLTPNGFAITQFKAILGGAPHLNEVAVSAVALSAVGVIAFALALRRLRQVAA